MNRGRPRVISTRRLEVYLDRSVLRINRSAVNRTRPRHVFPIISFHLVMSENNLNVGSY